VAGIKKVNDQDVDPVSILCRIDSEILELSKAGSPGQKFRMDITRRLKQIEFSALYGRMHATKQKVVKATVEHRKRFREDIRVRSNMRIAFSFVSGLSSFGDISDLLTSFAHS
jgi:hypothetical protein